MIPMMCQVSACRGECLSREQPRLLGARPPFRDTQSAPDVCFWEADSFPPNKSLQKGHPVSLWPLRPSEQNSRAWAGRASCPVS